MGECRRGMPRESFEFRRRQGLLSDAGKDRRPEGRRMGCCRPLPEGSGVGRRKEGLIPDMTPEKCPCPGMRPELRRHRQRRTGPGIRSEGPPDMGPGMRPDVCRHRQRMTGQGMRPGMRSGRRGCVPGADRP